MTRAQRPLAVLLTVGSLGLPAPGRTTVPDLPLYFGAGAGRLDASGDHATSLRGFAGWQFTPAIAGEMGYYELANRTIDDPRAHLTDGLNTRVRALDLAVLGVTPDWHGVSFFARLGAAHTRLAQTGLPSRSGTAAAGGGGLRLRLGGQLFVRAEWQRFGRVGGSDADWNNASVSFGCRF